MSKEWNGNQEPPHLHNTGDKGGGNAHIMKVCLEPLFKADETYKEIQVAILVASRVLHLLLPQEPGSLPHPAPQNSSELEKKKIINRCSFLDNNRESGSSCISAGC